VVLNGQSLDGQMWSLFEHANSQLLAEVACGSLASVFAFFSHALEVNGYLGAEAGPISG